MTDAQNKPWCPLPFVQFANDVTGRYQACCIASRTNQYLSDVKPMDFFNSDYMKQLRYDMLNDTPSELVSWTCKKCIKQESDSGFSKRTDNLGKILSTTANNIIDDESIEKVLNKEDLAPTHIDHLKLKIYGNKCNLRCVMCSPDSSSKIAAEMKKYKEYNGPTIINPYADTDPKFLYEGLGEILPYLNMLELVGGEPFMFPELPDFMRFLIDSGYARKLKLRFITNGTIIDPEIMAMFKWFKRIDIVLSVDAYGKKDDYIRDLSNWEDKVKFIKTCSIFKNLTMGFSNTYTWINVGHLYELYEYFYLTFGISLPLNNPVTYPICFQAVNLPDDIREIYLKNYEDKQWPNKEVFINLLTSPNADHGRFMEGMTYLKKLDKRRGKYLLDQFPEFEKYYNEVQL